MISLIPAGTDVVKDTMIVTRDKVKSFNPLRGLAPAGETLAIATDDRPIVFRSVEDSGPRLGGINRRKYAGTAAKDTQRQATNRASMFYGPIRFY
jgi:hypothetical protein